MQVGLVQRHEKLVNAAYSRIPPEFSNPVVARFAEHAKFYEFYTHFLHSLTMRPHLNFTSRLAALPGAYLGSAQITLNTFTRKVSLPYHIAAIIHVYQRRKFFIKFRLFNNMKLYFRIETAYLYVSLKADRRTDLVSHNHGICKEPGMLICLKKTNRYLYAIQIRKSRFISETILYYLFIYYERIVNTMNIQSIAKM